MTVFVEKELKMTAEEQKISKVMIIKQKEHCICFAFSKKMSVLM